MAITYPMTIAVFVGLPLVLTRVEPKESELAFGDEIGRAVDSTVQQVGGDGQREPHWKIFDTWLPTSSRPSERALVLRDFEDRLRYAIRAEIDGLQYPITRIRVTSRSPYATGYRLGMRMIGPKSDFIDQNGDTAPLW